MSLKEDVLRLKKEKNAIILAHYYVDGAKDKLKKMGKK